MPKEKKGNILDIINKREILSVIWSSSTAYTSGQYVVYGNYFYRCIKNATAGTVPTNTTYWEKTNLASEITTLNKDLGTKQVIVSNAGVTVSNILKITGTFLCSKPNNKNMIYCQISGAQLQTGVSTTDYRWLSMTTIVGQLANAFGASSYSVDEQRVPIQLSSSVLSSSNLGYGPYVEFWYIDGTLFAGLGRYYTTGYDPGLLQMSMINNGYYSFSFIAEMW